MTASDMRGTILKGIGGFYYIAADNGQVYTLRARGVFRKQRITPLVGDAVRFTPGEGDDEGWIDRILERKNELVRPQVANISRLLIVIAPIPAPDLLMVDTLLVHARRQGITPVLVINKTDLDGKLCAMIREQYLCTGDTILMTSIVNGDGLDALAALLQTGICCFAGQSGVGKSSLVSTVTGIELNTGEISGRTARGKHTTRHTELFVRDGFQVLDTAGFSLLAQAEAEDPVGLKDWYPEFIPFESQCRFQPCYHHSEPGCAVLEALEQGKITRERVERYHQLLNKAKEAWKGRYE